jgi:hypothetical protein
MISVRAYASLLMVLAAMLLAILPRGFMPSASDSGLALVICSAGEPSTVAFDPHGQAPAGDQGQDCPMAVQLAPLLPEPAVFLGAAVFIAVAHRSHPALQSLAEGSLHHLRPPPQGPPAAA